MLEIDGSYGEGGGQILRTALSLSCILGRPFRMVDIRKGRKKPGLMHQHLACVRSLARISSARVTGDAEGSTELVFEPSSPKAGDYLFEIGTAGSTSLLLQALLPPLIFCKGISRVRLTGGTHVPFSPTFDYIDQVFLPMLARLGIKVMTEIERYGFYPKGGGSVSLEVHPAKGVYGLELSTSGRLLGITGISGVGNLPLSIAERQRSAAIEKLKEAGLNCRIGTKTANTFGQGTFLFLKAESGNAISGFSVLGERGKRAEAVGTEAATELIEYIRSGTCIDHHLSDQLLIYLAFADKPSEFTTSRITDHLMTNLWTIEKFAPIKYRFEGETGKPGRVVVTP